MAKVYKVFNLTLTAGQQLPVNRVFRFFTVLDNSISTDPQIAFDQDGDFQEIPKGLSVELPDGETVSQIRFYNPALVSMTLRVAFSAGRIYDNRVVIDDSNPIPIQDGAEVVIDTSGGAVKVVETPYTVGAGSSGLSVAPAGTTILITAAGTPCETDIKNTGMELVRIKVGTSGYKTLELGESVKFRFSGTLIGYSLGTQNARITILSVNA